MSIMKTVETNLAPITNPISQDPLYSEPRFAPRAPLTLATSSKAGQRRLRVENVNGPMIKAVDNELLEILMKYGGCPMLWAAKKGDLRAVQILLDNGFGFELNVKLQNSPLYEAILNGHTDVAKLLIDNGHPLRSW